MKTRFSVMRSESGITLIEVLVVVLLIGLIYVAVGTDIFKKGESVKAELNVAKMSKLDSFIQQYRLKYNRYPGRLEDLVRASSDVQKTGVPFFPLASDEDLIDIWGFPFLYQPENNSRSYVLKSLGKDGVDGGEGANQDIEKRPGD